MDEQFDIAALERVLSKKERVKKEPQESKKRHSQDKPLLTPVDREGKEVEPKDIKVGKTYKLKSNKN